MSIQVGLGGICFAHGPYTNTIGCPDHDCEEIIIANGPNPKYVEMARKQVYENSPVYSESDLANSINGEYLRIVDEIRKLPNCLDINMVLNAIAPKKEKHK